MPCEDGVQAVGQGVVLEIWDAEKPPGRPFHEAGHDSQTDIMVKHTGGEAHRGQDQGHKIPAAGCGNQGARTESFGMKESTSM
jgi:hypothetical protein